MRKIRYKLDIGYAGCGDEGTETVPDDMTDADIDAMVQDMAQEHAASWEGDNRLCWDEDMSEEDYQDATEHFYEGVCGSWSFVLDGDEDED
jgi:hypothetical protein